MPNQLTNTGMSHVADPYLTGIATAYMQKAKNFVAANVFPVFPVTLLSDSFIVYPKGAFLKNEVGYRPMGGKNPIATRATPSPTPYNCVERGLSDWIDERERKNASPMVINPERDAVMALTKAMLIDRDQRFAAAYFKTGVWSLDHVGVAAAPTGAQLLQWNQSASDPIQQFQNDALTMLQNTGLEPNGLLLGANAALKLVQNSAVINRVSGGATTNTPAMPTLGGVENWLRAQGLDISIQVAKGIWDSSADGAASASTAFILDSNSALLYYRDDNTSESPNMRNPTAGYIFSMVNSDGAGGFDTVAVRRGIPDINGNLELAVNIQYDTKVVSNDLAVFYSGISA